MNEYSIAFLPHTLNPQSSPHRNNWYPQWMDGWMDVGGQLMDGRMNGWVDGYMDGWIGGWMLYIREEVVYYLQSL